MHELKTVKDLQQVDLQREEMQNVRGERFDRQKSQSIQQYDLGQNILATTTKDDTSLADTNFLQPPAATSRYLNQALSWLTFKIMISLKYL